MSCAQRYSALMAAGTALLVLTGCETEDVGYVEIKTIPIAATPTTSPSAPQAVGEISQVRHLRSKIALNAPLTTA